MKNRKKSMKTDILQSGEKFPLDTSLTLDRVRRKCAGFFSMKLKGERVTVRKGFVISSHLFVPSRGESQRKVVLYAYHAEDDNTDCVCLDCGTTRRAHKLIDWLLGDTDSKPKAIADIQMLGGWEPKK